MNQKLKYDVTVLLSAFVMMFGVLVRSETPILDASSRTRAGVSDGHGHQQSVNFCLQIKHACKFTQTRLRDVNGSTPTAVTNWLTGIGFRLAARLAIRP
jgi:hypothetical protein